MWYNIEYVRCFVVSDYRKTRERVVGVFMAINHPLISGR